MKIILAGGTGFIGKPLTKNLLDCGHHVVLLTRQTHPDPESENPRFQFQIWDAKNPGPWQKSLGGADAVINLAGEGIAAKRWSTNQKKKILDSRIDATRALVEAIRHMSPRPKVLLNASAVGYYGNVPEGIMTEKSPCGAGFLAEVCHLWEKETLAAESAGLRVIRLRTGIVPEKEAGALSKMLFPFQFGLGGPLGSGTQWMSWIHRKDLIRIFLFLLENPGISGAVNAAAPHPVRMKEFAEALGKILRRPALLPVPALALRILLGELSSMLLKGQKVLPEKLLNHGFDFKYPDLEPALRAILNK